MKKIFIITGEASGDKLASKVILKLKKDNPNIEFSCVGGTYLNAIGIRSIFDLKEITYLGFTSVIFLLLNQKAFAVLINEKVEIVANFESGKAKYNQMTLNKMERHLGVYLSGSNLGEPKVFGKK